MRQGDHAITVGKSPKDAARAVRPKEPLKPEEPALTPFIDIIFQILIFFMLSMKFKQQEGHLLSMLPREVGPESMPSLLTEDVRIYLCADADRRMDQHIGYKERHQDFIRDQKRQGRPVGDVVQAQIELLFREQRQLYRTEAFPSKWGENRRMYEELAAQAKTLHDSAKANLPPGRRCAVILDLDGTVPFEHAIGVFNSLQKRKVTNVEWAGNPRFDRYYGPQ
jgi:biopolymer transport protein ExbD